MTFKNEIRQKIELAMGDSIPKNIVVTFVAKTFQLHTLRLNDRRYITIEFNKTNRPDKRR